MTITDFGVGMLSVAGASQGIAAFKASLLWKTNPPLQRVCWYGFGTASSMVVAAAIFAMSQDILDSLKRSSPEPIFKPTSVLNTVSMLALTDVCMRYAALGFSKGSRI